VKFILGFFIGLLTGVVIILGPIVALFIGLALYGYESDDPSDEPSRPTDDELMAQMQDEYDKVMHNLGEELGDRPSGMEPTPKVPWVDPNTSPFTPPQGESQ
jgi:hypothetical protein